ncbi:MAG: TetR/AcrR family transcriptional regulator [Gammaproteobacteria bacterium]|nr:TetR/AcrR family transcriptional regulator [Gammaproteobacteria bacterium]
MARSSYHHGDLRSALVREGLALLEEQGEAGLSLRGIARRVGVSQTAPYSHFANKRELLAAVATVGFERFGRTMQREAEAGTNPSDRLLGLGVGYVLFALENPALFRLMFAGDLSQLATNTEFQAAAGDSFGVLRDGVGAFGGSQSDSVSTAAWALVHGLAELLLNGRIERPESPDDVRALVRRVLSVLNPSGPMK